MGNLVHLCKETKESIDKEEKSIKKLTPYVEVKKAIKKDPIDALEDAAIKKAKELKAEHDAKKKLEEDAKKKLEEEEKKKKEEEDRKAEENKCEYCKRLE